jgi:hypothetical protein
MWLMGFGLAVRVFSSWRPSCLGLAPFCILPPLFHAFAEDYLLEEVAPGRTQLTYSVTIEPRLMIRIGGRIAQTNFGSQFSNGCKGLQSYVLKAGASSPGGGKAA